MDKLSTHGDGRKAPGGSVSFFVPTSTFLTPAMSQVLALPGSENDDWQAREWTVYPYPVPLGVVAVGERIYFVAQLRP